MQRSLWGPLAAVLCLGLSLILLAQPAGAHGGTYSGPGPGDTVPGGGGGGRPRAVPTRPRPAAVPQPARTLAPVAPPAPAAPKGPRAASTPNPSLAFEADDWSHWWRINQHEYLLLKDAVWSGNPVTGEANFALGAGQRRGRNTVLRPTVRQLAEQVAPALERALATEGQPQVLSGLLMALAKLGELPVEGDAATSGATIQAFLEVGNQEVQETAALALGLLGDAAYVDELTWLCLDDARSSALLGRDGVSERTRSFAAYGLGFLAQRSQRVDVQRYIAHALVRQIEARERGSYDLPVACLNALSLVSLPAGSSEVGGATPAISREALLEYLLEMLDERRVPDRVKAHVPRVIARLLDPFEDPLKERVAAMLGSRATNGQRTAREVQYGAIQALGLIGTAGSRPVDVRIRRQLQSVYKNGDLNARNLSLIAMAKLGARPHPASPDPVAGTEEMRAALLTAFARGKSRTRPWAALALGVHGFHARAADLELSTDVSRALRRELDETRSAADAGAVALALGLRAEAGASARVIELLDKFHVDATRAHLALALGLLGESSSGSALRTLIDESTWRPELFRSVAIGLALLGDKQLVPRMNEAIDAANSSAVKAVHAWALAWTGDARGIGSLLALLADPAATTPMREVVAVGIGGTCERERLPWLTRIASDVNYFAAPPTLTAPQGGGLLDIR